MVTTLAILNCSLDIEYEAIIKKTLSRIQSYGKNAMIFQGQTHYPIDPESQPGQAGRRAAVIPPYRAIEG
jgi:hypothetical protein